jgi:hypothetical protein
MESSKTLLNRLADVLPLFENAVSSTGTEDRDWEFSKKLKSSITLLIQAVENLKPHFGSRHFSSEKECRDLLRGLSQGLNHLVPPKAQSDVSDESSAQYFRSMRRTLITLSVFSDVLPRA